MPFTSASTTPESAQNRVASCSLLLAVVLTLGGCGTKYSSTTGPAKPVTRTPVTLPETPEIKNPTLDSGQVIRPSTLPAESSRSLPAAIALRDQAESAASAGNHQRAIGLLERAIRISPQDPLTFEALAHSHLALNQPTQALQLVRRGLSLNPGATQRQSLLALADKCQAMM